MSCAILPVNQTIITSNQFACQLNLQESDVNSDKLSEPKVKETFNISSSHRNRVKKTGTYRRILHKQHIDSSNLPTPKANLQEQARSYTKHNDSEMTIYTIPTIVNGQISSNNSDGSQ